METSGSKGCACRPSCYLRGVRFPLSFGLPLAAIALLFACSDATKAPKKVYVPGDDFYTEEDPIEPSDPDTVNPNGFPAGERPAPPEEDAGIAPVEAGPSDAGAASDARVDAQVPSDGGGTTTTYCTGPLVASDLLITEFLISSRSGSADDGEWVELSSTRTCTLKLGGLVVESPRGTLFDRATLPATAEVAPLGKVLVVGSTTKAGTFGFPEPSYAFAATDILKNDGDRISVRSGTLVIDQLDYPAFSNVTPARSVAFPKNCPANVRNDWARWSLTFTTYAAGAQRGTPGRDNTDVTCY